MLRELRVPEVRYRAVLDALAGAAVTDVALRYGVSRQTVHVLAERGPSRAPALRCWLAPRRSHNLDVFPMRPCGVPAAADR
jgi:transposase-like protein